MFSMVRRLTILMSILIVLCFPCVSVASPCIRGCGNGEVKNSHIVRERLVTSDRIRLIVEPVGARTARDLSNDILTSRSPREMALTRIEEELGSRGMRPEKRMPLSGKLVYEVDREQI